MGQQVGEGRVVHPISDRRGGRGDDVVRLSINTDVRSDPHRRALPMRPR
jgi:hypothetical protein